MVVVAVVCVPDLTDIEMQRDVLGRITIAKPFQDLGRREVMMANRVYATLGVPDCSKPLCRVGIGCGR